MNKLLIVGFDGLTWDVAKHARMPHLEELSGSGGRSSLRSTYPPVTCPAWPTYLTGKKPSNHGVYDFAKLSREGGINVSSYEDLNSPTLIDVLNDQKRPSIFFEIPLTFPAPEGLATVISGYPAEMNEKKFSDPDLREELEEEFGSFPAISPARYTGHNQAEVKEQCREVTRYRSRAFTKLLEERDWQFATINFHLSDQFAHYFWDQFEASPEDNPLTEAYELLDEVLGEILEVTPDSTNVMVMSDHGQGKQTSTVNFNYALMKGGYLKLKPSFTTKLKKWSFRLGLNPGRIKSLLDRLNLTGLVSALGRKQRDEILNKFLSYRDVDFERSEAFAFGHVGQIYWTGDDLGTMHEIKDFLEGFNDNGESLDIEDVIELRSGSDPSFNRPKWLIKMNDWAEISYPLFLGQWNLKQPPTFAGCHRMDGVLTWNGPDLTSGDPSDAGIIDLAPTAHRLLDLPPQKDFDGRVLTEILSEDAPPSREPRQYGQSGKTGTAGDDEEVKEQLKNLGYL